MKKGLLVVCILVLALIAVGCAPKATEEGSGEAEAPEVMQMVITTGGTSGSYFPMGGAIASVITNHVEGVSVTAQTSGGSTENLILIERGECELGLAQNDAAEYAWLGKEMYSEKHNKPRAIATLYPELVQIVARKDTGIKNIEDIKGHKVSIGAPGSGSEANARQYLNLLGIPYDSFQPQFLSNTDAADQFKDEIIDCMILTSGLPSPALMDISTLTDVTVVGFTEEQAAKINKEIPFLTPIKIPAGTYRGQNEDVLSVTVQAVLFASEDIPEDIVYEITKALWENKDELVQVIAKAENMDPKDPVKGVTIPVHPGALKYYKEIGIEID